MSVLSTWPDATDPFRELADSHSGLDFAYGAGRVRDDNTVTSVAAGTVTLTDATTNYVEVSSAGTVSANTTGFTAGAIPLYTVVTAAGAISTVTDRRAFLAVGGGATARPLHVGSYYTPPSGQGTTTVQPNDTVQYFIPFDLDTDQAIDRIACEVTTAGTSGAVARLGAYADDGGLPGDLIFQGGSTVSLTTTGFKTLTVAQTLTAPRVWLSWVHQGGASTRATMRMSLGDIPGATMLGSLTVGPVGGLIYVGTSGALPDPAPASGSLSPINAVPRTWVRAA